MDEQTQLDWQFGLEPIIESIEEPSQITKGVAIDSDSLHSPARKARRHVSKSDEATTSAMNNLALKNVPKTIKKTAREPDDDPSSASAENTRVPLSEPPVARLRKRKSQESPDPDITAKRISPSKSRSNKQPTHVAPKLAIGQLSRPSDPLHAKKLQTSRRSVPAKNKLDIPTDLSPKMPSRKVEQPKEQGKKPRGRPRKEDAVIVRSAETVDELPAPAVVPNISRSSRRLHPGQEGLGLNGVFKDREFSNSQAKGSKSAAIPKQLKGQSVGKVTTSEAPRTQTRGNFQASKSSSPRPKAGGSTSRHGIGSRVTRSTKGESTGPDDLIAPDEWSKIPESRNKEQRQGSVPDESMSAPISVPDSAAESQEDEDDGVIHEDEEEDQNVIQEDEDEGDSVIHEDEGDEVSDYESNHLENSPALSYRGSERQAVDQNTAQEPNDSDEADQSSEDEDIASDSEDQDEPAFELFGGAKYWDQVIEGARTVGTSRVKDNVVSKRPKIATETGQDLVALIRDVESLYNDISSSTGNTIDTETVEHHLQNLLENLEEVIDGLSESNAPEHDRLKSLLVQDVYAHAIPAMVFMFRAALRCRTEGYSEPNDTEALEEIVEIQDLIILLCDKARRWKAPPLTKRPIKGPVANNILPYMRNLKERCFGRELDSRKNSANQKSSEQQFMENYRKIQDQKRLEKEQHRQKIKDRRRLIYQCLQQRPKAIVSRTQQSTPLNDAPRLHQRSHSNASVQWTREQNADLVRELLNVGNRDLPGRLAMTLKGHQANLSTAQERYLAILNTPSLQNKLPEHIRDRALYYKDLLIQDLGPKDYVVSIE